jgi:hypothetical protein
VRRPDGSPIPRRQRLDERAPSASRSELTRADREGFFRVTDYPGSVQVAAGTRDSYSPWIAVELEAGELREIDLVLR